MALRVVKGASFGSMKGRLALNEVLSNSLAVGLLLPSKRVFVLRALTSID